MKPDVHVVLAKPIYPSNIGQTARAMSNLGVEKLHLVQPPEWTEETYFQARQGAARSQAPLELRKEYTDWSHFYQVQAADSVRIGFSRRQGRRRPVLTWQDYLDHHFSGVSHRPHLLIFGPEDSGLSADDLDLVHHVCELPSYGDHCSYNLSQAVLLALFMLVHNHNLTEAMPLPTQESESTAGDEGHFPEDALKDWIELLGFTITNRRISALSVLKRLLLSKTPTPHELKILESVIFQTIRKLKQK